MKLKALLGILVVSSLSANAFAIEIHKGRIISDTQNLTAYPKAVYKDTNKDLRSQLLTKIAYRNSTQPNFKEYVFSKVYLAPIYDDAIAGQEFLVRGETEVYVENNDATAKVYNVRSATCFADFAGSGSSFKCVSSDIQLLIEPTGSFALMRGLNLPVTVDHSGVYAVQAFIDINREDNGTLYSASTDEFINVADPEKR